MTREIRLGDQAARDAIIGQLGVNMLVEAGAGAGKTGSTARRVAAMVASGACRVEEIAAVTYTRKAAAELVGRCRIELERRLVAETGERAQRLRQALADMERMFAGTIHAFCAQLLRERPVEAGIAPDFAELDESMDSSRRRKAWREFIERMRLAGDPVFMELDAAQVRPQDMDGAFGTLCLYPDVQFPAGDATPPDATTAWVAIEGFATELQTLLPAATNPETTCPIQKQAREFFPALKWADRGRPSVLAQLLARWEKDYKPTQKWWGSKADALQAGAIVQQFQAATVVPFLSQWRRYLYRLIVTLGVEAREFAADSRRRDAELNYDDLLQRTAAVLRTNGEVRTSLQRKYARLFVDEFQDTDPIQTEIVFLLAAEPGTESDWTKVSLRHGALFLVGDPKQSIFRFRRADIDIYERAKQRIRETGGQVVELTTCFRAIPALSDWANTAFSNLFPQQASPQQPAYSKLDGVNEPSTAGCGVVQLCLPASLGRKEVPTADAQAIASYIANEVTNGRRTWRDFLILTRKKANLASYARELERAGVQYEVTGSEAFQDSPSVEALSSLLYCLANADDAPALVGVLRGPLFGFDDEELFSYHRGGGKLLLNAPVNHEAEQSVADALAGMQEMYRWTRTLPVGAAVERILERTGLIAMASAESAGGGEAGKLLFAVDCLRAANESGASFAAAVEELETRLGAGEADAPALESGRQDVVRLMNLHKAKGLEAKVVFLADPLAGVKPRADLHIVREGNRATGYFQVTRSKGEFASEILAEPEGWAAHESTELAYVSAEELRLLYVACTRPMEMLVVSRWDKSDNYGVRPWETLAPFLAAAPALEVPGAVVAVPATVPAITDEDSLAAAASRETLIATILAPTSVVEAVTGSGVASTHHAAVTPGEPCGPAWGRIIHALLERAASDPSCKREDLERWAMFHVMADSAAKPFEAESVEAMLRVMASPFWAHVCEARVRLVEVPIMVEIPESSPRRLETGVIDLVLQFDAGWEIIDYKTDGADLEQLVAQYGQQVQTYAAHWERITGERVVYAGIYSVRENAMTAETRAHR